MKLHRKSFGIKLWVYFILFAAIIFAVLWLLQTVFLQYFYNRMAIRNAERTAAQIAEQRNSEDLRDIIDGFAYSDSLLIFLTDWQGSVFYSADEHNAIYEKNREWHSPDSGSPNPYRSLDEPMNWQIGANRNLPRDYFDFLQQLAHSADGTVGYSTENGAAYIYGRALPACSLSGGREAVLYLSIPLGAAGAAVGILRVQLVWVTLLSLALGFAAAFLIAHRFARPISALSAQARRMADGAFDVTFEKGFCLELDALSDTLGETAAALARLENARRELLANISHDLRTPLTMIKGYAEMVRYISWEDETKRDTDLAVIVREADRLTALVCDILEYSQLQSAGLSPEFGIIDLGSAARWVIEQFAPLCEQTGRKIEASAEPGQWVRGDEKQLTRVLYNLIDNALRHTDAAGIIRFTLKSSGGVVRAEVRDFGEGIAEDALPRIWDRYFTSKQRRGADGSGLGLAIAKEILLGHGARFGADSEPGRGCTFWFELEKHASPQE